ncbi:hypothetical protein [Mycobacteroides abscessus]
MPTAGADGTGDGITAVRDRDDNGAATAKVTAPQLRVPQRWPPPI